MKLGASFSSASAAALFRSWRALLAIGACLCSALPTNAKIGAEIPWTTIEAETMGGNGKVLGPEYGPHRVETESSGQKCVALARAGQFVEFEASGAFDSLVVRFNLPDAPTGGGTRSALDVLVNGKVVRHLDLTSRNAWLYGNYPFSNDPAQGKARNFYDEVRVKNLSISAGDVVRLRKSSDDGVACNVDLVDVECMPAPLAPPTGSYSVHDFGAKGDGHVDDTGALRRAVAAAAEHGGIVWVPAGEYQITGDIVVPSHVTIQGAGWWHTTFVGDAKLYGDAARRVRFKLTGEQARVADFAIVGELNYRNDDEANDGIVVVAATDARVSRVWIEHTKAGVWVYNGTRLTIEGCRFRNLLADGVNLCVGTNHSVIENCTARGTGDDCFAIWPAASDQGHDEHTVKPGHNVIRRCTGQLPFLANGGSLYGGASNRIEDCRFTDIVAGCGILISTTFQTADEAGQVDNTFSGTTVVENCELVRCGGYDHTWAWRGSVQICVDRRNISGLVLRNLTIRDSLSESIGIVAPGRATGHSTLSDTVLENVTAARKGLGAPDRSGLWVRADVTGELTLQNCDVKDVSNESNKFKIQRRAD